MEIPWVECDDRNEFLKDFFRDHNAERKNIVLTLGHYGCRSLSRAKKLQDNPAARAGATPTGNDKNLARQALATQGMMPVDDFTAEWIEAAPETQLQIAGDDFYSRTSPYTKVAPEKTTSLMTAPLIDAAGERADRRRVP